MLQPCLGRNEAAWRLTFHRMVRNTWSNLAVAGTGVCLTLSWLWPIASGPSSATLPWLVCCTCFAMSVILTATRATDLLWVSPWAWLVAALLSSGIGLLQYFGVSAHFAPWINIAPLGEAFGNLRQRNQFATLTSMGLSVLMFAGASVPFARNYARDWLRQKGWQVSTGVLLPAAVLLATANAATLSRTGLVQLMLLGLLALVWRRQTPERTWWLLGLALLTYALASLLLPMLIGRDPFDNGIGSRFRIPGMPCEGRWLLWQNVTHLIAQKPWWGWGWGEVSYAHFITLYPAGRFCDILDNAHNLPLHLAVVWGIPAAVALCGVVIFAVLRARPWRETVPVRQMAWAVLTMIGLHSMLEYPLWYGPFQIATVLAIWILWRTRPQQLALAEDAALQSGTAPLRRDIPAPAVLVGAGVLLVALAYAAWDYHRVSQVYKVPSLRSDAYREDTLRKVQDSWLFRKQVRFAALTLATVTPENAQGLNAMARELLHFSPESRVIEKLIDSDLALGRRDDAAYFMLRYRNAFPADYERWKAHSSYSPLPELPPPAP